MSSADTATNQVSLRPVTGADGEFLLGLYASTRKEELDQVAWAPGQREEFLRMQFQAQDIDYRRSNPQGTFDVIEVSGRPAGRLYVDRRPGDIRIIDIALVPDFRGSGIGTRLITGLQQEAGASESKLSIHVEIHNPAERLYSRLGFVTVADRGFYRLMEWGGS